MLDQMIRLLNFLSHKIYTFLCPKEGNDLLHTQIHSKGKITVFFLSQMLAFSAALIVLLTFSSDTFIVSMMFLSILFIVMNFLYLRLQIITLYSATLVFAVNVYISETIVLFGTELSSITIYGFFPAVIGGLFFLGTRLGTLYAIAHIILLFVYHHNSNTPHIVCVMEFLALLSTFSIAFFYEFISTYHSKLLESTLEEAKSLAQIDQLTGILNRREFFYQANALKEKCSECCMVMIDIDDFKVINDTYGHAIGDSVLKLVTQAIRFHIRDTEPFGRIGGEEFAVVLPLGNDKAYERCEMIRRAVEECHLEREKVDTKITVSIGIVCQKNGFDIDMLMSHADEALYKAKRNGKNQVRVGELPPKKGIK